MESVSQADCTPCVRVPGREIPNSSIWWEPGIRVKGLDRRWEKLRLQESVGTRSYTLKGSDSEYGQREARNAITVLSSQNSLWCLEINLKSLLTH